MPPSALPPFPDFDGGRQRKAEHRRRQRDPIALIRKQQERLARVSSRWEGRRSVTFAKLAGLYARLHMYGRCLEMYEHSLAESDLVMVRIKLAWLLVSLCGEEGFARARELARGRRSTGPANRWIGVMIKQLIRQKSLAIERLRYKTALDERYPGLKALVGDSKPMLELCRSIVMYADSMLPVLLTGATGTGKEVVARALHACSRRASQPFVAFNCTCLTADLAARELFGHVKGAFTGADRAQPGYFDAADRGTLLLDEVGDLPAAVQGELLRVLSSGDFHPVGGAADRRANVRVIAATNRDLRAMITEGRFREDLYHRLAGCELALPSLNERRGDVPQLARYFLHQHTIDQNTEPNTKEDTGQTASTFPEYAVWAWAKSGYLLTDDPFAGNVRSLEQAVQRDAINETLLPGDDVPFPAMMQLPTDVDVHKRSKAEGDDIGVSLAASCYTLEELAAYDLRIAIRLCDKRRDIAELFGIRDYTVSRRLKALGLKKQRPARSSGGRKRMSPQA